MAQFSRNQKSYERGEQNSALNDSVWSGFLLAAQGTLGNMDDRILRCLWESGKNPQMKQGGKAEIQWRVDWI